MIGTTIEHYRIEERLGGGGMGDVYRALDLELDREVAIKCVRADLADIKDVTRRFRAEARTLAKLSHPNIATVFRFFAQEEQLFLVMEYIAGDHFGALLRQQGALPHGQAVQLMRQALSGLGYAHEQKVVHRDIKPANLMVDGTGTVKVLDFGIAHLLDTTRMTRTGGVLGTPAYMAPEQALGKPVDERTDIYSLGIVLYEMLTGDLPFQANSDFELMRAHVEAAPRALRELSPSIPPGLQSTVMTALAKDSTERYQTAGEFSDALRAHLDDSTQVSVPLGPTRPEDVSASVAAQALATTLIRKATSPLTKAALVGAGLALALAAGIWLLSGSDGAVAPDTAAAPAEAVSGPDVAVVEPADAAGTPPPTPDPAPADASTATATDITPAARDAGSGTAAPVGADSSPRSPAAPSTDGQTALVGSDSSSTRSAAAAERAEPAPVRASIPRETAAKPAVQQPTLASFPRASTTPEPPSVRVRKISVHERQGTGRFSRAAGYNGDFDLLVPGGAPEGLQIDEYIEVSQNGRQVLRELVTSDLHEPGVFESKHRVQALKELTPGVYDVRLEFVAGGRTLGSHDWQLEVVD